MNFSSHWMCALQLWVGRGQSVSPASYTNTTSGESLSIKLRLAARSARSVSCHRSVSPAVRLWSVSPSTWQTWGGTVTYTSVWSMWLWAARAFCRSRIARKCSTWVRHKPLPRGSWSPRRNGDGEAVRTGASFLGEYISRQCFGINTENMSPTFHYFYVLFYLQFQHHIIISGFCFFQVVEVYRQSWRTINNPLIAFTVFTIS